MLGEISATQGIPFIKILLCSIAARSYEASPLKTYSVPKPQPRVSDDPNIKKKKRKYKSNVEVTNEDV